MADQAADDKRKYFSYTDPVDKEKKLAPHEPTFWESTQEDFSPHGTRAAIEAGRRNALKNAGK